MAYFEFLMNQWIMSKLTTQQVSLAATKAQITQAQADVILATPKA